MVLIEEARAGAYDIQIVEKASRLSDEFFAPRYYFLCTHPEAPWLTAIAFLGQNLAHAKRQFDRRRDLMNSREFEGI